MLAPPLLVASFLFVGLLLFGLAFLLSRQVPPSLELRFAAVVTGVMGVVSLAFTVLVRREILGARRPRPLFTLMSHIVKTIEKILVTTQPCGNGERGWPTKTLLKAAKTLRPCFLIVEMYPRMRQKACAPPLERKHPETFC